MHPSQKRENLKMQKGGRMRPLALLLAVSSFTVLSYAQTTTTAPAQPGLVITSGYATVTGPVSPPMLVTPTANLGLMSSSPVGATSGTSNNQVGASNMTLPSAPLPAVQSVVQLNNPNMIGLAQPVMMQAATPEQATEERTGFDAGAAQFGFSHIGGTVDRRSLGEIAKEMKGQPRPASGTRVHQRRRPQAPSATARNYCWS
jgi:hypothetical protein